MFGGRLAEALNKPAQKLWMLATLGMLQCCLSLWRDGILFGNVEELCPWGLQKGPESVLEHSDKPCLFRADVCHVSPVSLKAASLDSHAQAACAMCCGPGCSKHCFHVQTLDHRESQGCRVVQLELLHPIQPYAVPGLQLCF